MEKERKTGGREWQVKRSAESKAMGARYTATTPNVTPIFDIM
jgi:hypothetical protein